MSRGLILPEMELDSGMVVNNAFVRIDTLNGNPETIKADAKFYASENFYLEGKAYIKQETYEFENDNRSSAYNVFKHGYKHLKTLPNFENARDA